MTRRIIKGLPYIFLLCLGTFSNVSAKPLDMPYWNMWLFSRANCINNESITFEYFLNSHYWNMAVISYQQNWEAEEGGVSFVTIFAPPAVTSRSAAVNWGAGMTGYWSVNGEHDLEPSKYVLRDEGWDLILEHCPSGAFAFATDSLGICEYTFTDQCW